MRPRYGEASLADVLPSVLSCLGVPGAPDLLGLEYVLHDIRTVVVLLVDGFGHQLLPTARRSAPTLAALAVGAPVLTAGFPTTTPTSLTTLGTGAPPGSHGVVGFFLRVPGTDQILNHIRWDDDPDPLRWQPLATQFDRARRAGVAAWVVSRPEYNGSGLTRAAFRGARYVPAADIDVVAERVLEIARSARGPTLIYTYDPLVDSCGHLYGVGSVPWHRAVADVDHLVTILLERLPRTAALVVTADHGQINVPEDHRIDMDADPRLRVGIDTVAGEPRVRYLHTAPGAQDDVIATWRSVLGDAAVVIPREQAAAEGWFGPIPEEHLQRVGDVVVICTGDTIVLATKTDPPSVATFVGFHGSATPTEMHVPLLIGRR
ncbi:MAG: alkaline phosphatase family protein [Micromonosporaceae bacterium]|nr:alkaline phosphatase family protein [Micromonosporaceae bacterium]